MLDIDTHLYLETRSMNIFAHPSKTITRRVYILYIYIFSFPLQLAIDSIRSKVKYMQIRPKGNRSRYWIRRNQHLQKSHTHIYIYINIQISIYFSLKYTCKSASIYGRTITVVGCELPTLDLGCMLFGAHYYAHDKKAKSITILYNFN